MIAFLVGTIESKREGFVVIDVGGVGYELSVSNTTLVTLPSEGETTKVLTYLQVSENTGVCLFGFATEEEKSLFLKLITVSGVGAKSAMQILSGMKLSDLMIAISTGDVSALSKIKGLGKKTAERICLELKDKLSNFSLDIPLETDVVVNESVLNDAIATLINLGVNKNEAYRMARSKMSDGVTAEEVVLKVLKDYGQA